MKKEILFSTIVISLNTASSFVFANTEIPKESGFNGNLMLGVTSGSVSSNTIAGDFGQDQIASLNETPDSESKTGPLFGGEFSYTFGESRTQIFLDSGLEDLLTLDSSLRAGIHQELKDKSVISGGVLFSGLATDVWADPFVTGQDRRETERSGIGGFVGWKGIAGTGLELDFRHRSIEVDDEASGIFLGLSEEDQKLLSREGGISSLSASYKLSLNGGHFLSPQFKITSFDLDGEARSRNKLEAGIGYAYLSKTYTVMASALFNTSEFDKENPVFDQTEEVDGFSLSLTGSYAQPFGLENWSIVGSVAYAEADSNIDFYDADVTALSLGMMYRF